MTNRAAAETHRRMDAQAAEAMARDDAVDGGDVDGRLGALLPAGRRRRDMATMARPREPRVLLMTLSERTSGRGTAYLSGWLGKARLVGFRGEDDERGNPTWSIFAAEPAPREGDGAAKGSARTADRDGG